MYAILFIIRLNLKTEAFVFFETSMWSPDGTEKRTLVDQAHHRFLSRMLQKVSRWLAVGSTFSLRGIRSYYVLVKVLRSLAS